jgi:hypothetical protein
MDKPYFKGIFGIIRKLSTNCKLINIEFKDEVNNSKILSVYFDNTPDIEIVKHILDNYIINNPNLFLHEIKRCFDIPQQELEEIILRIL